LWRVRTTLVDRPGILAEIALACGTAQINILAMQVFPTAPRVTDEFVVSAPDGWTDLQIAGVFEGAGGAQVAATRVSDAAIADAPTRYLNGVHQVLDEGRDVEDVLAELLETEPPDVADYAGHDILDLTRRNGSTVRISRAVPFTPVERARAQALISLVGDDVIGIPLISPPPNHSVPLIRAATLSDVDAVTALHERCSIDTLYERYQVPLRIPMTARMVRRLVAPNGGQAVVVQVGLEVVGHGLLELVDSSWTFHLLIEDAWQGRGLGAKLVKHAAGLAKAQGADRLTFITAGSHDVLLRTVGNAGFLARVERHDGMVHISVPLSAVRAIAAG
jgi:GNAT superfamily N-acetyltransferase